MCCFDDDDPDQRFVPSGKTLTPEELAKLPTLTPEEIKEALAQGRRDVRAAIQPNAVIRDSEIRYRR